MLTFTAVEARTRFGEILTRVARGEEIVITRRGRPVARIVPEEQPHAVRARRAVAGLNELRERIRSRTRGGAGLSDAEVRAAITQRWP